MLAVQASESDVTTFEALDSPLKQAFHEHAAIQCGFCVAGVLMNAAALLKQNPRPTETEVRAALDRNLCRCGSQNRMVRAVLRAAKELAK